MEHCDQCGCETVGYSEIRLPVEIWGEFLKTFDHFDKEPEQDDYVFRFCAGCVFFHAHSIFEPEDRGVTDMVKNFLGIFTPFAGHC